MLNLLSPLGKSTLPVPMRNPGYSINMKAASLHIFPPGVRHSAVSISIYITSQPEYREKTEEMGANEESTGRAADPDTDVGEVGGKESVKMENE